MSQIGEWEEDIEVVPNFAPVHLPNEDEQPEEQPERVEQPVEEPVKVDK